MSYRHNPEPAGCAFLALFMWLIAIVLTIAFWGLVAYGIWTGIEYLQTH